MKYRIAQIFAPKDMGTDGTEVIDLNVVDKISRIMVCFTARNGSNDMDDHPAANLTKIELVDGSDVLYSLSGPEGQALNFYTRKEKPWSYIDNHNNHWNSAAIGIDFGRFLNDPLLALDPALFRNLQLKVTYDEDVCELEADENYLSVFAHLFDEKPITPIGFLVAKDIKSFTPEAGAYEYTDIPTDRILKGLFVNTKLPEYTWSTHIAEVRLSEDNDKRIPIDMDENKLLHLALEKYGYVYEHAYIDGIATEENFFQMATDLPIGAASSYGDDQDVSVWNGDGGKWSYWMASTSFSAKAMTKGALPHGSMPLLYHDDQEIDDWYDVTTLGSLVCRVKGGSSIASGTTCEIIVQQLRKYA